MVNDCRKANTSRRNFKAQTFRKEEQKKKDFPKTWASSKNQLKIPGNEKNKNFTVGILVYKKRSTGTQGPTE